MIHIPTLESDRLILRPCEIEDADMVQQLACEKEIAEMTLNVPHPYPQGAALQWIQLHQSLAEKGIYEFAIVDKNTNTFIGATHLNASTNYSRGELAYWIGKPYWRNGFGTEAAKRLVQFGLEDLKLNKVYGTAYVHNEASQKVLQNAGLKYEGTLKKHVSRDGQFYDLAYYGILAEDYTT
ncbi:GNAT family N-acetyltransferase [Longirhabdus pacifica]|uniref:GNAT family N-acetyltransferase n=1 Tax=Longirhabdus pacifica TaxID=2305227 RepID=UPI001008F16F|nr:GNAT family protein [Longirhabdus pacifica]